VKVALLFRASTPAPLLVNVANVAAAGVPVPPSWRMAVPVPTLTVAPVVPAGTTRERVSASVPPV